MNKKIVQINSVCNGSTGKIMGEIEAILSKNGYNVTCFYGRRKPFKDKNCEKICNKFSVFLHGIFTLLFNYHGCYSYFTTKKMIKKLKRINPDIIHLHNIHGYYLNYNLLFKYLKNDFNGKVYWTLHDCWSFTGHCAYFDYIKCNKWKEHCNQCPQLKTYPISLFFDTSYNEYKLKKETFTNVNNLTIITPSKWLKELLKKSYLNKYKIKLINNGINLQVFKPIIDKTIYKKYNIKADKKIILGVASPWSKRKGFDDFLKLSKIISNNYQIVLVGLTNKQLNILPENIIGISRTDNQKELVKIYSIADVFVNPTLEDNYPTVNLEAIACGTPIVTYNTGGCKEQVFNNTGFVCNNFDELLLKINYCLENDYKKNIFDNSKCLDKLNSDFKYNEYLKLYEKDVG